MSILDKNAVFRRKKTPKFSSRFAREIKILIFSEFGRGFLLFFKKNSLNSDGGFLKFFACGAIWVGGGLRKGEGGYYQPFGTSISLTTYCVGYCSRTAQTCTLYSGKLAREHFPADCSSGKIFLRASIQHCGSSVSHHPYPMSRSISCVWLRYIVHW